jgi:hypothetical protein
VVWLGFTSTRPVARIGRRLGWRPVFVGVAVASALVAALAVLDVAVGYYQRVKFEARKERQKQLQKMAWYELRADMDDVTYTADGKYRMKIWLENVFPEHDYYVAAPAIRAFVQVGPRWIEVPTKEASEPGLLPEGTVVNLKERRFSGRVFEISMSDYFELLPGYMHVKFDNTMYVSPDAQPKDDLVERTDNYYIHLRPIGADDERLRRLNRFPGPVPIWIGMPPH